MDDSVRQLVTARAGRRCEYCRLPQQIVGSIRFHVEHIRARQHGGGDHPDNLALACPNCNWNKGPNISAVDPTTGVVVPLFNPRGDNWHEHFALTRLRIEGLTPAGRATIRLLRMNSLERVELRQELARRGELDVDG